MKIILITGSSGAIGAPLCKGIARQGYAVRTLDIADHGSLHTPQDIRSMTCVREAMHGASGVIHLAAVSRVVWAEDQPSWCQEVNVIGTENLVRAALEAPAQPWLIFASSREVYGQPADLPANEQTPKLPRNVYGRAKLAGEHVMERAAAQGLRTAILRLPNVYGSLSDHKERVIPAFMSRVMAGEELTIAGPDRGFDFLHIDDTVSGFIIAMKTLEAGGEGLPTLQLATGRLTTLWELANLVMGAVGRVVPERIIMAHSHEVERFYAKAERAAKVLGWSAKVSLDEGLARMARDLEHAAQTREFASNTLNDFFAGDLS